MKNQSSTTLRQLRNKLAVVGLVAASQFAPLAPTALAEGRPMATTTAISAAPAPDNTVAQSAAQLRTKNGYLACFQQRWLQDFITYSVAGDHDSANAYIASQKCVPMRGGLVVTRGGASVLNGTVSVIFDGTQLWTVSDAIETQAR